MEQVNEVDLGTKSRWTKWTKWTQAPGSRWTPWTKWTKAPEQGHGAPQTQPFPPGTQRATDAAIPPKDMVRRRRSHSPQGRGAPQTQPFPKHFSISTHTYERGSNLDRILTEFQKVVTCPMRATSQNNDILHATRQVRNHYGVMLDLRIIY